MQLQTDFRVVHAFRMYTCNNTLGSLVTILIYLSSLIIGQVCNLGTLHRASTSISTEYVYENLDGNPRLIAEKALDGKYYDHPNDCAGSVVNEPIGEAWWKVTFKSISKIFKINLVFRELCKFNYTISAKHLRLHYATP